MDAGGGRVAGARDGANAVVFSLVDAVLLDPFPYRASDRLVFLWGSKAENVTRGISGADLADWQAQNRTFVELDIAWATTRGMGALLFATQPLDAVTYAAALLLLGLAALGACGLPLRRALRFDPVVLFKA